VISTAPTSATKLKAKSLTGCDLDYRGMLSAALAALAQAQTLLAEISNATDAGDPNAATLASLLLSLT